MELHPTRRFEKAGSAPIWSTLLRLSTEISTGELIARVTQFHDQTGLAVRGYIIPQAEGCYFYMTRYPGGKTGGPPELDNDTCEYTASKLAESLGADRDHDWQPGCELMALIGLQEGYANGSNTSEYTAARRLFEPDTQIYNAQYVSVRRRPPGQPPSYHEPAVIVWGGQEIVDSLEDAAYALGQHHIPVEDYRTQNITIYETDLAS